MLDAATLESLAPLPDLIDAVEGAYRAVAGGRDRSPLRAHVALPSGDLLLMPGVVDGASGISVKLVTIVPANRDRGLPTVQAVVSWVDGETGAPVAMLDGNTLTLMRTGAGTGVATRLLARPDASVLAMIGAGGQAEWQVRGVAAVRDLSEVRIWSPSDRRVALAARLAGTLEADVRAAGSPDEAVRGADIVCCATTSTVPVLDPDLVAPGAHVNGIGAYRPGMVELPAALFARAATVAVDSAAAALAEAGDLLAALEAGAIDREDVVEVGALPADAPREPDAVTVFKSVGLAAQDAAAAQLLVERARAAGLIE